MLILSNSKEHRKMTFEGILFEHRVLICDLPGHIFAHVDIPGLQKGTLKGHCLMYLAMSEMLILLNSKGNDLRRCPFGPPF